MPTDSEPNLTAIAEALISSQDQREANFGPFIIALVLDSLFLGLLIPLVIHYYQKSPPLFKSKRSRRFNPQTPQEFLNNESENVPPPRSESHGANGRNNDGWVTKCVVAWALVINIVITFVIWKWNFDMFVINFAIFTRVFTQRYQSWMYTLDSLCISAIQGFYMHKAYIISQRKIWVVVIVSSLILIELGSGIALTIEYNEIINLLHADSSLVINTQYIWMVSTFLGNAAITGVLTIFLINARTGWSRTDKITAKLIRVVFEAQLLPAVLALGLAVLYSAKRDAFYHIPFLCCQAKIYAIGLMYTLNSRTVIRRDVNAMTTVSRLETKKELVPMETLPVFEPEPDKVHIQVDTYVYSENDAPYLSQSQKATARSPHFQDFKSTHTNKEEEDMDEDFDDSTSMASVTLNEMNRYSSDTRLHKPDF